MAMKIQCLELSGLVNKVSMMLKDFSNFFFRKPKPSHEKQSHVPFSFMNFYLGHILKACQKLTEVFILINN